MKLLDHTYPTPAENLACEEALLETWETAAATGRPDLDPTGLLRFWESPQYFVVVGYANRIASEVNEEACRADGIPIYRRCSGGGTVLQGPGCLNYALVMPAPAASVTETNRFVMERHRAALETLLHQPVAVEGVTDLTLAGRKFSGNAQRRKRRYVLFHGTFLLDFDLRRIETYLRPPTRQPAYRQGRPHTAFLCNLGLPASQIRRTLAAAWDARQPWRGELVLDLAKYTSAQWNRKF
jgi:lipoate-protein ligase A